MNLESYIKYCICQGVQNFKFSTTLEVMGA